MSKYFFNKKMISQTKTKKQDEGRRSFYNYQNLIKIKKNWGMKLYEIKLAIMIKICKQSTQRLASR